MVTADSTPCRIEIHRTDQGYLFRVTGRGTLRESPAVRDFARGAMEDGVHVVIDLSGCEHLDSTFLGCLVILSQQGDRNGGLFHVYTDRATRQRLFGVSHLDQIVKFVDPCPTTNDAGVTLQVTQLDRKEFCEHLLETHQRLADLGGPCAETFQRIVERLRSELKHLAV